MPAPIAATTAMEPATIAGSIQDGRLAADSIGVGALTTGLGPEGAGFASGAGSGTRRAWGDCTNMVSNPRASPPAFEVDPGAEVAPAQSFAVRSSAAQKSSVVANRFSGSLASARMIASTQGCGISGLYSVGSS